MRWLIVNPGNEQVAARVAVASIRNVHPEDTILVLDLQPTAHTPIEGTIHVRPAQLRVGGFELLDLVMALDADERVWAAIPAALAHLGDAEDTIVLPAHCALAGPITDTEVEAGIDPGTLAFVPRIVTPNTDAGVLPGVVLAGTASAAAVEAWLERVEHRIRSTDATIGDPWAERWNAPGVTVTKAPMWRVHPSTIAGVGADTPPTLIQAPGFDPRTPWWFAEPDAQTPPIHLTDRPALRAALHAYAAKLLDAGWQPPRAAADPGGVPDLPTLRTEFRRRLVAASEGEGAPPPNPYRQGGTAPFIEWMRGPGRPMSTGVSLIADLVWEARPDLAGAFPHVRWLDQPRFVRWLWANGVAEGLITTALLPDPPERRPAIAGLTEPRPGVNLIGYHRAELGLGVAVRRIAAALDAEGVPWEAVDYDRTNSRRRPGTTTHSSAPYAVNLLLVTADQLGFLLEDVGPGLLEGRYNVGLWYWETDALTPEQHKSIPLVDEIWGATEYLRSVYARHTEKPVVRVPIPLEFGRPTASPQRRADLGLDDRFTFLFSFDFLSIVERKNPLGLVEAFSRAFGPEDGCRLILKCINGDQHAVELERLLDATFDRPDIDVWDFYLDGPDRLDLVANVDCYVSLHRSEGLGLTIAEAMSAGVPVIATGYSGNLDFMGDEAGLLVRNREVVIGPGGFYPADGHWADPDLDHAAELMRRVHGDPALRRRLATAGPRALAPFSTEAVGRRIGERVRRILHSLPTSGPAEAL